MLAALKCIVKKFIYYINIIVMYTAVNSKIVFTISYHKAEIGKYYCKDIINFCKGIYSPSAVTILKMN